MKNLGFIWRAIRPLRLQKFKHLMSEIGTKKFMLNLIQGFMTVINELKKYVPKIHILGSNSVFNISSKNTHNYKFKMAVNDPLPTF
jgi:hypothetical protein